MDVLVSKSINTKTHIQTTLLSDWISTAFASELTIQPNRCGHELFQRISNLIFDYYSTATSVLTILHPLSHDKGITQSLDVVRTQKMSRDWRPVLTTYRRGHTWLTGVTLKCTSDLTVWRAHSRFVFQKVGMWVWKPALQSLRGFIQIPLHKFRHTRLP